ncbi:MAG: hypothetical protein ACRDZP_01560, partial [Acidimicrobiales bacterium]
DVSAPHVLAIAGWAVIILTLGWGLLTGNFRQRVAICVVVVATVMSATVLTLPTAHSDGIIWSGRYVIPLAIGGPVVATVMARPRGGHPKLELVRRWLPALVVTVALLAQFGAMYSVLRDYSVGRHGTIDLFLGARTRWSPPIPVSAVAGFGAVAALAAIAWFLLAIRRAEHRLDTDKL